MPKEDLTSYLAHYGIGDDMPPNSIEEEAIEFIHGLFADDDSLLHYGVMGMKWGKRKKKPTPEEMRKERDQLIVSAATNSYTKKEADRINKRINDLNRQLMDKDYKIKIGGMHILPRGSAKNDPTRTFINKYKKVTIAKATKKIKSKKPKGPVLQVRPVKPDMAKLRREFGITESKKKKK